LPKGPIEWAGRPDGDLQPKQHLWTTFHAAGAYAFYCRYHPGMTGTLVVKGPAR
jgi:plastocyanin